MATDSRQVGKCKTFEECLRDAVDSLGLCATPEKSLCPASRACSGRGMAACVHSVDLCATPASKVCSGRGITAPVSVGNRISSRHLGINEGGICKHSRHRYPKGIISDVISVSEEDFQKAVLHYTGQLPCPQMMARASITWDNVAHTRNQLPPLMIPNASPSHTLTSPSTPHSLASTLTWDSTSHPATPNTSIGNPSNLNTSESTLLSPKQGFSMPSTISYGNTNHSGSVYIPKSASVSSLDRLEVGIAGDQFEDTASNIRAYYNKVLFSDQDD